MAVYDTGAKKRISDFIGRFKMMEGDACAVFSPEILKDQIYAEVSRLYSDRKIARIDWDIQDKGEIDKIFSTGLKNGSLLLAGIGGTTHPHLIRRIEELLKEGHISMQPRDKWIRVEPVEGFQLLVWVNREHFSEGSFVLSPLIGSKLVLEK